MWEINFRNQSAAFLYSLLIGGVFCLTYDIFRAVRCVKKHSHLAIFFEDIFCFMLWGIAFFCFLLATTNGEIRFFAFAGAALGFAAARLTVSRFFVSIFAFFAELLCGFLNAFGGAAERFFALGRCLFGKIGSLLRKKLKKA